MNRYVYALLGALTLTACTSTPLVKTVKLEHDGLAIQADISASRQEPAAIIGKLRVINASGDFRPYGNFQLFLTADGEPVQTTMKTQNVKAMADTRLIQLAPGDTLNYFVKWTFPQEVEFNETRFGFIYDDSSPPPAEQPETPNPDVTEPEMTSAT